MNQFKRVQVIILSTSNIVNSLKGYEDTSLLFKYQKEYKTIDAEKPYVCNYHLYIISDDEIKGDSYVYSPFTNTIIQLAIDIKFIPKDWIKNNGYKKVIATTDSSLKIFGGKGDICDLYYNLPQPSQQFIKKYIESYNKSEVITDVLVEYENIQTTKKEDYQYRNGSSNLNYEDKLKINPKDNTITIKKLKDSWNREEVHNLMMQAWIFGQADKSLDYTIREKWIEKNL